MTVSVVVVGGGPRGLALLSEVSRLCDSVKGARLAGVVLDNPSICRSKRYTMYEEFAMYPVRMNLLAKTLKIPMYSGSVKSEDGTNPFEDWIHRDVLKGRKEAPLLFIMAAFGQRIRKSTLRLCNNWFINTHPVAYGTEWDDENPYRGPTPWELMLLLGIDKAELVAHIITEEFDAGYELTRVGPIEISAYNGMRPYFRTVGKQTFLCRPSDIGEFVHAMHKKASQSTRLLARQIIAPEVLNLVSKGSRPSKKVIFTLFNHPSQRRIAYDEDCKNAVPA